MGYKTHNDTFAAIVSYALMNRLRTGILNKMREIVSSANIEKIHLVLSTSSDFYFFLSQGFSKYHDPEIIVYQYDRSDSTEISVGEFPIRRFRHPRSFDRPPKNINIQ